MGRIREFIVTDPEGAICGLVRIVQAVDGRYSFHWLPGGECPETHAAIAETMRASQFLDAWMAIDAVEGLRLAG